MACRRAAASAAPHAAAIGVSPGRTTGMCRSRAFAERDHLSVADDWLTGQVDFYEADAAAANDWILSLRDPENIAAQAVAFRARLERLRQMLDRIAPKGRFLEIAAGTGTISVLLAPHAEELLTLDSSASRLEVARDGG